MVYSKFDGDRSMMTESWFRFQLARLAAVTVCRVIKCNDHASMPGCRCWSCWGCSRCRRFY